MTITELIKELESALASHGDLPVYRTVEGEWPPEHEIGPGMVQVCNASEESYQVFGRPNVVNFPNRLRIARGSLTRRLIEGL